MTLSLPLIIAFVAVLLLIWLAMSSFINLPRNSVRSQRGCAACGQGARAQAW